MNFDVVDIEIDLAACPAIGDDAVTIEGKKTVTSMFYETCEVTQLRGGDGIMK
jgi:hypothetical protein